MLGYRSVVDPRVQTIFAVQKFRAAAIFVRTESMSTILKDAT